ncbi:hypothetical protein [Spirosoma sp. KUDC1026]|nr:hypothetical protein [Spirosoma sp. KUDC1026]
MHIASWWKMNPSGYGTSHHTLHQKPGVDYKKELIHSVPGTIF